MKKTKLQKWNRQLAERIALRLLTDGRGEVANRLVLEMLNTSNPTGNCSGWCEGAIIDQIEEELNS